MTSVKIAELKDKLSEHLRAVERGREVIVTDRNRPIARIVAIEAAPVALAVSAPKVPFSSLRSVKYKPCGWALSSSQLLADERRDR